MSHRPPTNPDHLTIQIDRDLSNWTFIGSREQCIDKVHHKLRKQSNDSYDPIRISIGPYHQGKTNLKAMEGHKRWYLQSLLARLGETTVDKYVKVLRKLEERARRCYVEPLTLDSDKFVKLMLLDGCFVIELFRKFSRKIQVHPDDKVFLVCRLQHELCRDLLLLENQLPFFVLAKLSNMTRISEEEDIIHLSIDSLDILVPGPHIQPFDGISTNDIEHLLDLMHKCWCFPFAAIVRDKRDQIIRDRGQKRDVSETSIKSATELKATGIHFKRADNACTLLDISFNNNSKAFEIPFICIDDFTESFLRNMVAYEQQRSSMYPKFVTDYIVVMDYLVNTLEDVGILKQSVVLENNLGDDEAITNLLNKLGHNVSFSSNNNEFSYPGLFYAINSHCQHRTNVWMAILRRDYFNTPWALVSFLAAVLLLLLTIVQAICSIISL